MKWYKALLVAIPVLFGAATLSVFPTRVASAMYYSLWKDFWNQLTKILLDALRSYLEISIERGYFLVVVDSRPFVTLFQGNPAGAEQAMQNGIGMEGETLVVRQDILVYSDGTTGVALKQGNYTIDPDGNFHFELVRVPKPVPSPTFPIPIPTQL